MFSGDGSNIWLILVGRLWDRVSEQVDWRQQHRFTCVKKMLTCRKLLYSIVNAAPYQMGNPMGGTEQHM